MDVKAKKKKKKVRQTADLKLPNIVLLLHSSVQKGPH
jgi:hypothetical protein